MKKLSSFVLLLLVVTLGVSLTAESKTGQRKGKIVQGLQKTATIVDGYFDGNRCNDRGQNTGQYTSHVLTNTSGFEWPKGTNKFIDYAAGVWVIGRTGGQLRTANCEYSVETAPGVILPSGQPDDPTLSKYKIYKIGKADLTNPGDDYLNWPVDQGAPVDENGKPALVGDQMLWYVYNDADPAPHANLFGTEPMGVEVHITIWGYNRSDAFGDMFFVKAKIINKSSNTYDSSFVGLWDDPDNGNAADDYVGCDTTLSLGYDWNSSDNETEYGAGGPAIGRDYFQGPIVPSPGDTALVSGRKIPGYKNLPMYAFAYYINGATYPQLDPETAQEAFNYMTGHYQDGSPFVDPITNQPTRFVFPGDPETGTGWTEITPSVKAPGDRRFLMSCGPFTFAPGDTQEVVFGVLIARGSNYKNSVTVLKAVDQVAQLAYDLNFALPPTPPTPQVTKAELDQQITLYWDGAAEKYSVEDLIDRDPDGNPTQYNFEGYIVYQVDALAGYSEPKRLAVFDIADGVTDIRDDVFDNTRGEQVNVTVVKGNDKGASRTYQTTLDAFTGKTLVNGHPYYYAVTAYGYNPYGIPKMYEGPLAIFTATPHGPPPGVRYLGTPGDTIRASHTGPGDGSAAAFVVDPSRVTGHDYKVQFRKDAQGATVWDLVDVTLGNTVVLADQTNQTGDNAYSVVDGIQVKVEGPLPGVRRDGQDDFNSGHSGVNYIPDANRAFTSQNWTDLGLEAWGDAFGTPGSVGYGGNFAFSGTTVDAGDLQKVELRFSNDAAKRQKGYRYLRRASQPPYDASVAQYIVNPSSGYAYQDYVEMPFTAWAISTAGTERQINVGFLENNEAPPAGALDGKWDPNNNRGPTPSAAGREVLWIFASDYSSTPVAKYQVNILSNTDLDVYYAALIPQRGTRVPQEGDILRIIPNYVNSPSDVFTFSTAGREATSSTDLAKSDINMINVFPNPYFGAQSVERDPINRFVTFSHLPVTQKTTIRIFTLAGALVRTISHTPGSTFERWDLRNSNGIPVASAMYLVHIEIQGLGTKILKVAIIQPEERLDRL